MTPVLSVAHVPPALAGKGGQDLDRRRFVVGDVVEPEVPVALARRPLDLPQGGEVPTLRRLELTPASAQDGIPRS